MTVLGAPIADAERAQRNRKALWIVLGVGITIAVATAGVRLQANPILGAMVAGLVLVSYQHVLLAWRTLLALILLVILFIPIRRYTVGGNMPIELEPYRIVIALVLACWFVRARRRPGGALAQNRARGPDRRAADLDAHLAVAEHRPRQRESGSRRQAVHVLPQLLPARLLHRERDPLAWRPGPHVPRAGRRWHDRRAADARRVAHRHEPTSTGTAASCRSCTTSTRARPSGARYRRAGPRLRPAPDRARRGGRDADPAGGLPLSARQAPDLARLRVDPDARRARPPGRAPARSC